jgi:hypothetical protein
MKNFVIGTNTFFIIVYCVPYSFTMVYLRESKDAFVFKLILRDYNKISR